MMSVDWQKAEENPDKSQKIQGRFLLDLRAKVNDLEKQLTDTRNELTRKLKIPLKPPAKISKLQQKN